MNKSFRTITIFIFLIIYWVGASAQLIMEDVIYLNNVDVGTFYFETFAKCTLDTILGKRDYLDIHYANKFVNFRIYDSERTAQERTDIYNYEKNFRPIDITDGLIAYYPLATNSLDNYNNEYDGTDTNVTYDGERASFNGSTSFINMPQHTLNSEFSLSF